MRAPDPVLATVGERIDPADPEWVQLAADLVATMRVSPGCVGLAAQQVGVAARIFCVDVSAHPKARIHHGTFVLCNAEVVEASRNDRAREGCMSVPDFTGDVKRASRLVVTGQLPGTAEQVTIDDRRVRGPRAPARDGPLRGPAVPRPGRRRARGPPAPDLLMNQTGLTPYSPLYPNRLEEVALKAIQSGFEPQRGHRSDQHPNLDLPSGRPEAAEWSA